MSRPMVSLARPGHLVQSKMLSEWQARSPGCRPRSWQVVAPSSAPSQSSPGSMRPFLHCWPEADASTCLAAFCEASMLPSLGSHTDAMGSNRQDVRDTTTRIVMVWAPCKSPPLPWRKDRKKFRSSRHKYQDSLTVDAASRGWSFWGPKRPAYWQLHLLSNTADDGLACSACP